MALSVVGHTHPAERCSDKDPEVAPSLLNLLGCANWTRFGVNIRCEAVSRGEHPPYVILETLTSNGCVNSSLSSRKWRR